MAAYKGIKAVLRQFYVLIKQKLDSIKVDADHFEGTLPVSKGGTGATDASTAFNTLADAARDSSTPVDSEKMLLKPSGTWYKTTCLDFWNYIKGKISSVLGLTKDSYNGNSKAISYTGEGNGNVTAFQTSESFNGSPDGYWASYIICNHGNGTEYYHQAIRLPFFNNIPQFQRRQGGTLQGWVSFAMQGEDASFPTVSVSNRLNIPTSAPSSPQNGDIWIE